MTRITFIRLGFWFKERNNCHRDHQIRQRQEGIGDPHEDTVAPALIHAADDGDEYPQRPRDKDSQKTDSDRNTGAIDQPAEHVAPQVIRPQQVLRQARSLERFNGICPNRVIGCEQRGKESAEESNRQNHE